MFRGGCDHVGVRSVGLRLRLSVETSAGAGDQGPTGATENSPARPASTADPREQPAVCTTVCCAGAVACRGGQRGRSRLSGEFGTERQALGGVGQEGSQGLLAQQGENAPGGLSSFCRALPETAARVASAPRSARAVEVRMAPDQRGAVASERGARGVRWAAGATVSCGARKREWQDLGHVKRRRRNSSSTNQKARLSVAVSVFAAFPHFRSHPHTWR